MTVNIKSAIAAHLMSVNPHQLSAEAIDAVKKEELNLSTGAIALGEGWRSYDSSSPVIYRRQLNFVQLSGIVIRYDSRGVKDLIGTVPEEIIPSHLVNIASTVLFSESGTKLCSLLITDTGQISLAFPLLQEDILWLSLSGLVYLIGDS